MFRYLSLFAVGLATGCAWGWIDGLAASLVVQGLITVSGVVVVQVCIVWTSVPEGLMACRELAWQQAYLTPSEAAGCVDILVNGDFSPKAFGIGAAGVLGSFMTGLLIGWAASLLRKARQRGNAVKAMKQRIAKLNPVASFHNLCITGSATVATSLPAFAKAIDTGAVESAITSGQGDTKVIGGYIVDALVILAVVGLIYSMSCKA